MIERDNLDVLKDEFQSIKNLSKQIEQEISVFRFQFLTQTWDNRGNRSVKGKPIVHQQDGIGQVSTDGQEVSIAVQSQLAPGSDCLLMKEGTKPQIIQVSRQQPHSVSMDQQDGTTQQYLMYGIHAQDRIDNNAQYQVFACAAQSK